MLLSTGSGRRHSWNPRDEDLNWLWTGFGSSQRRSWSLIAFKLEGNWVCNLSSKTTGPQHFCLSSKIEEVLFVVVAKWRGYYYNNIGSRESDSQFISGHFFSPFTYGDFQLPYDISHRSFQQKTILLLLACPLRRFYFVP